MDENTTGIELPDDMTTLDDKGLEALKSKILKEFEKINSKERVSAADLAKMGALTDQMDTIKAEENGRVEAQKEAQAQRQALAAKMAGEAEAEEGSEEAPAIEAEPIVGEEAEPVEGEPIDEEEEEEEVTDDTPAAQTVIEALAASLKGGRGGAKSSPRIVPAARTKPREAGSNITIIASAGIDRVQMGTRLDLEGLGNAMVEKARMLPDAKGSGQKHLVASIEVNKPKNDQRKLTGEQEIAKLWKDAHDVQSMVASGGWCSPSETIYDFACDFEAMPDMLDLPSITGNRGGLRYPTSPLLGDVFDDINSGFTWTEADDIAAALPGGPTKPCFVIPCPEFLEERMQAQGVCVTAGNLMDRSWPENIQRNIDLVMTAHAHRMNGLRIQRVVAASTPVSPTVANLNAQEAVLAAIELQIICARDQFFMSDDQVLEAVAPRWLKTVMRRALARVAGVDYSQIGNAEIRAFFSEIGARIQFVSNWQSLRVPGAFAGCVTLPATVDILLYPAGAHTLLDGGTLDLGVVRDSTLNSTNDYTAAWTEEFWGMVSRCFSLVVTVPLCADGSTGSPVVIACPTA